MKVFARLCLLSLLTLVLLASGPSSGDPRVRKFYEYKGDYRAQVNELKEKFKSAFGYELVDLDQSWKPAEIEKLHTAFAQLPETFYRLSGLKAFYRLNRIQVGPPDLPVDEVPAATLPTFTPLYERRDQTYRVYVEDQDLRIEFYNPLFYEDPENFTNIVQHEMGHAFDAAHEFLSFSAEWINLTRFRVVHLPALDARPDSNFLYSFLNDPQVDNYAPVSLRNLPTYSRQNIQEDFANSVSAYIHYPYFRFSHPARYGFLKDRVFKGKEYFPADSQATSFRDKVLGDFSDAMGKGEWDRVKSITEELSRGYHPKVEAAMARSLHESIDSGGNPEKDFKLGAASCYLLDPQALGLRRKLIRQDRVALQAFLKDARCFQMGRDAFEKNGVKWAPANIVFFRQGNQGILQFLDPILRVAHARGFQTRYLWSLNMEGGQGKSLAEGSLVLADGGNGAVKIDLAKSADREFSLPSGRPLILELGAQRINPKTFKTFNSEIAQIRFVLHPWFNYEGPATPKIQVVFPARRAFQHQD